MITFPLQYWISKVTVCVHMLVGVLCFIAYSVASSKKSVKKSSSLFYQLQREKEHRLEQCVPFLKTPSKWKSNIFLKDQPKNKKTGLKEALLSSSTMFRIRLDISRRRRTTATGNKAETVKLLYRKKKIICYWKMGDAKPLMLEIHMKMDLAIAVASLEECRYLNVSNGSIFNPCDHLAKTSINTNVSAYTVSIGFPFWNYPHHHLSLCVLGWAVELLLMMLYIH